MLIDIRVPEISSYGLASIEWKAKEGDFVFEDTILCTLTYFPQMNSAIAFFTDQEPSKPLTKYFSSPLKGTLVQIYPKEKVKSSHILCKIEQASVNSCPHNLDVEYGLICVLCGEELTSDIYHNLKIPEKQSCAVINRNLKFSESVASNLEESKKQALLKDRKLILVLDLDHTLIHSASGHITGSEVFNFTIDGNLLSTKLRPHLSEFLSRLSHLYEFCVYTMGGHKYADHIVEILDPDHIYFGGRVISKEQSEKIDQKDLKIFTKSSESMFLILDDTTKVWNDCENLIVADRYLFFSDEQYREKFSGQNDCYLLYITDIFEKIHQEFYQRPHQDVRDILRSLSFPILSNFVIVLSGIVDSREALEENELFRMIQRFGGKCQNQVTEETTHVVARYQGTKKTKLGKKLGKHVVSFLWLHLSIMYWIRLSEHYFTFENVDTFDVHMLKNILNTNREDQIIKRSKKHEDDLNEVKESLDCASESSESSGSSESSD